MLESKSTLLFRTVDYRVFKDGYLFKLMDTDRRTGYKLMFMPFDLHPSVLMLDFLMADVSRSATLNDDLMSMIREDLSSGSVSEFIVLGSPESDKDALLDNELFKLGDYVPEKDAILDNTLAELGGCKVEGEMSLDAQTFEFEKLDRQGALSEIGESIRIHNKKKLHKVSKVAMSRDILKELGKLEHTDIALRIDRDKLVIDKVGSSNRDYVSGGEIIKADNATRTSVFKGDISKELGTYFRPYRKGLNLTADLTLGDRQDVFGLDKVGGTILADRPYRHDLSIDGNPSYATRSISKGFLYTDHELLDFYVEVIPRYLKVMRPEILAQRVSSHSMISSIKSSILAHRDHEQETIVRGVINATRDSFKHVSLEDTMSMGRKKAPQYPSHMHFLGNSDRLNREDVYLQAVSDVVRDITKGDLVKPHSLQVFERDINNSLEVFRERLHAHRDEKKDKVHTATVESTLIKAYRDMFHNAHVSKEKPTGSRIYLVKAMVDDIIPQGERKYDNVLHISHEQPQGSRDITQNAHINNTTYDRVEAHRDYRTGLVKSTSEMYERDYTTGLVKSTSEMYQRDYATELIKSTSGLYDRDNRTGLYLPSDQQQAGRSDKGMVVDSATDGVRDRWKDTHLTTSSAWERDRFKDTLLAKSDSYERDSSKKLDLEYTQMYDRVRRKLTHLRDEWLEILINGGELPENDIWDAILMDDMLFGELLGSPAWIEEYVIMGDSLSSKIGVITADFMEGTRQKIQALIDSDILLSSREGDTPGEIISINYDALKLEKDSVVLEDTVYGAKDSPEGELVEYPDLRADKVTIPKYGWLDELENPLGYLDDRVSELHDRGIEGERDETKGHLESNDLQAIRPDLHESSLEHNTPMGSRFTKDADVSSDEILASKGDSFATVDGGNILGGRAEIGATIDSDELTASRGEIGGVLEKVDTFIGKLWDREGTLADNVKNLLGTAFKQATSLLDRVWAGTKAVKGGIIDDSPTQGTKAVKGGYADDSPTMGTKNDRESIPNTDISTMGTKVDHEGISVKDSETMGTRAGKEGNADSTTIEAGRDDIQGTVDTKDYTGSKLAKDGMVQDDTVMAGNTSKRATLEDMKYAELKGRLASAVVDFIFAQNSEKEAEGLHAIVTAVKEDRAFTLMEHVEGYKEERYGTVEEQVFATPEKLGDVIKGILATPEKYGINLDSSMLGQGILHDYNDDLLSEGNDVEGWSGGYGFGVPDDYDPLDPFNNYYPYTSDYTSHELAQAVSWTKGSEFDFKADTDIIKLSTTKDSIAVADVSGDNYKFSVDFRVNGNKDTAVDIVVRYTNENNYYVFRINGGDRAGVLDMSDNMQLYKVTHGKYSPIGYPMSPHKWVKGTWHRVEVSLLEDGSKLLIKVDDRVQYDMRGY